MSVELSVGSGCFGTRTEREKEREEVVCARKNNKRINKRKKKGEAEGIESV